MGIVFVKLERLKNGIGILRLRDTNNDGVADDISGFGNYGGTGIGVKNGYIYASSDENVYRYKLGEDGKPDSSSVEMILKVLSIKDQHSGKGFTLDNDGNIYVNIGAPSNSCQVDDRQTGFSRDEPMPDT